MPYTGFNSVFDKYKKEEDQPQAPTSEVGGQMSSVFTKYRKQNEEPSLDEQIAIEEVKKAVRDNVPEDQQEGFFSKYLGVGKPGLGKAGEFFGMSPQETEVDPQLEQQLIERGKVEKLQQLKEQEQKTLEKDKEDSRLKREKAGLPTQAKITKTDVIDPVLKKQLEERGMQDRIKELENVSSTIKRMEEEDSAKKENSFGQKVADVLEQVPPIGPLSSFVRNIASSVPGKNEFTGEEFPKLAFEAVVGAPAKFITSLGIDAAASTQELLRGEYGTAPRSYTPQGKFEQLLFGEEPIDSFSRKIDKSIAKAEEYSKKYDLSSTQQDYLTGAFMTAPIMAGILDILPVGEGGLADDAAKAIARSDDVADIVSILKATFKGPEGSIDDIAKQLVKVTDAKEVKTIVDDIAKMAKVDKGKAIKELVSEADTAIKQADEIVPVAKQIDEVTPIADDVVEEIKPVFSVDNEGKQIIDKAAVKNVEKEFQSNVNFDKFNATDDVIAELKRASDGVQLDNISNETMQELAAELGSTPEKLLRKYKSNKILTAPEALLADRLAINQANKVRAIQKRITKAGDISAADSLLLEQEMALSAALMEMASGNRRRAGQLVQQYKITRDLLGSEEKNWAALRKVFGDDWDQIQKGLGDLDINDNAAVVKFIQQNERSTFEDKLYEYWVNGLLSATSTHLINITGNSMYAAFRPVIKGATAGVDWLRTGGGKIKPREVYFGEAAADVLGMKSALREGLSNAFKIMKDGIDYSLITKLEDVPKAAIKGKLGEVIRTPGRALVAMDEFFKAINHSAALNSIAYRDAMKNGAKTIDDIAQHMAMVRSNPSKEFLERSIKEARQYVFQKELGTAGSWLMQGRKKFPGAKWVMPFMKTPINIAKEGLSLTPLNFAQVFRKSLSTEQKMEQFARATIGSVATVGIANMVIDGNITGSAPSDTEERDAFYREGKQPYSIKIGDKWFSYGRLEPFGTMMGITADAMIKGKNEGDVKTALAAAGFSFAENMKDKTFMKGISDLFEAFSNFEKKGDPFWYFKNFASSAVPSSVYQLARLKDETIRDPSTLKEFFQKKLPGQSEKLLPKRNVWGEQVKRAGGKTGTLTGLYMSNDVNDPVDKELERLGYVMGFPSSTITMPKDLAEQLGVSDKNRTIKLNDEEYNQLLKVTGKVLKKTLEQVIESPQYKEADIIEQEKLIDDVKNEIRKQSRTFMLEEIILNHAKELKGE